MKMLWSIKTAGFIIGASLLSLALAGAASAQAAVEYGIMAGKSAPLSGIGKALEGRFGALSKQASTATSPKHTSQPQRYQEQAKGSSTESPATPTGPTKFTIHSSEGTREVTVDQPSQDQEQSK
jgi:hypothetical protein